jgi:hypothetical protein
MNTEERILLLKQAAQRRVLKGNGRYGTQIGGGQIGLTRSSIALSLLKEYGVKRIVPDTVTSLTNAQTGEIREYRQKPEAQTVWCLGTGIPHDFYYGNTFEECLTKAEKSYKKWLAETQMEA